MGRMRCYPLSPYPRPPSTTMPADHQRALQTSQRHRFHQQTEGHLFLRIICKSPIFLRLCTSTRSRGYNPWRGTTMANIWRRNHVLSGAGFLEHSLKIPKGRRKCFRTLLGQQIAITSGRSRSWTAFASPNSPSCNTTIAAAESPRSTTLLSRRTYRIRSPSANQSTLLT